MREKIADLENKRQLLKVVAEADMICEACPNRRGSRCVENIEQVVEKDRQLISLLGLKEQENYSYQLLLEKAQEAIKQDVFEESCGNCRWYLEGLCSFEKWKTGMEKISGAR